MQRRNARLWSVRVPIVILVIAWGSAMALGTGLLWRYKTTPGAAHRMRPDERFPVGSSVPRVPGKATLVMTAHPQCVCTRASLTELAKLMERVRDRLTAHVLFVRSQDTNWNDSPAWTEAARIPGVTVSWDDDGRESALFDAKTSGQTLLYDAAGRLLFGGGITFARGHEGDNAGSRIILALLAKSTAGSNESPVYGCALASTDTENAAK